MVFVDEFAEKSDEISLYYRNMAVIMRSHPREPSFDEWNEKVQYRCDAPPFNYGSRQYWGIVRILIKIIVLLRLGCHNL